MKTLMLFSSCLLLAAACSSPTSAAERRAATPSATLFEGARLITGEGSVPIENSAFLMESDRITRVGKKGEIQLLEGATPVDLTGKTVIPALVDAHSHLGYTDVKRNATAAANYTRVNLVDHLKRYAYYGIAATLSMGVDRGEIPDRGVAEDDRWLSETVPPDQVKRAREALAKRTPAQIKRQSELFGVQARNLAKLNAAGLTIGFGTDAGVSVGWPAHAELADMVTAGMTPSQVIVAATQTSAAILKLNQLGSIAPGKSADFIVLNGNPLDDIANARRSDRVYLRGQAIDRAALKASWNSTGGS